MTCEGLERNELRRLLMDTRTIPTLCGFRYRGNRGAVTEAEGEVAEAEERVVVAEEPETDVGYFAAARVPR
jgi:hypothetical protein